MELKENLIKRKKEIENQIPSLFKELEEINKCIDMLDGCMPISIKDRCNDGLEIAIQIGSFNR